MNEEARIEYSSLEMFVNVASIVTWQSNRISPTTYLVICVDIFDNFRDGFSGGGGV